LLAVALAGSCTDADEADVGTPNAVEPPEEAGAPLLRIDPPVANVVTGERTWAMIRLADGYETAGVSLEVTFDPRYVRIEDSDPDAEGVQIRVDGLCDSPLNVQQDVTVNEVDQEGGVIKFESSWSLSAYLCADAQVASIDVRGVTEGGCPLRFAKAELVSDEGNRLTVDGPGTGLVLVGADEEGSQPVTESGPDDDEAEESAAGDVVYHTVQSGETIFAIALEYGTTVEAIVAANGLEDADALSIGQRLAIPTDGAPAQPASGSSETPDEDGMYTIQSGDTLLSIAQKFGTTVEALAELNDLEAPYAIVAGEQLRVR
jgi:LysM repeat protein